MTYPYTDKIDKYVQNTGIYDLQTTPGAVKPKTKLPNYPSSPIHDCEWEETSNEYGYYFTCKCGRVEKIEREPDLDGIAERYAEDNGKL